MVYIINSGAKEVKKTVIQQSVDNDTVIIGRDIPAVGRAQTQRMLEERLDTLPQGEDRKVYEKVWSGVKSEINLRDNY